MEYPQRTTHVMVPLYLFKDLLEEAEVGYHGFEYDTDLANKVLFVTRPPDV